MELRLAQLLDEQIEKRGCTLFSSNLRVKVPKLPPYRYPDLSALCDKPEFEEPSGLLCLTNPMLLGEILSPSTEAFDRGEKFPHYKSIPSFREYLLLAPGRKNLTHDLKQSECSWLQTEYDVGATLHLVTLDCTINIDALYDGINFESETSF